MEINRLSLSYQVRALNWGDVEAIYDLSLDNPMFYQYCPPAVTKASILDDMCALPPGKEPKDKCYIGFFESAKLVAVMDLIWDYPTERTTWLGLFMVASAYQGKGVGSQIIEECMSYLKELGVFSIQLAFAKGNTQSEAFWTKNRFVKIGKEVQNEGYTAVMMERKLSW